MQSKSDDVPVLIGFEGEMDGQRWMLHEQLVIGRDPSCDISIPNRQVSRHHVRISPSEEGVILEDLRSKNGTHRNGKPISGPILLADGDIIHIALAQKFVFMSADATLPLDVDETLPPKIVTNRLRLDPLSRRVWIDGEEILPALSLSQFRLLEILYNNANEVVSRTDAMAAVWGETEAFDISEQALDALVRRLRDRLASIDPKHNYVVTIRGHGFRLDNPPAI